jgi:hypothetical protein
MSFVFLDALVVPISLLSLCIRLASSTLKLCELRVKGVLLCLTLIHGCC